MEQFVSVSAPTIETETSRRFLQFDTCIGNLELSALPQLAKHDGVCCLRAIIIYIFYLKPYFFVCSFDILHYIKLVFWLWKIFYYDKWENISSCCWKYSRPPNSPAVLEADNKSMGPLQKELLLILKEIKVITDKVRILNPLNI